ncbi:uncharacterized protein MONBRDRAFT_25189 [Monosiga brevicollis MX1]|uniref:PPM-type phosphatase domain-containing protein n=1 Tax=Monosiga brevicollis TaxID=81824 RepID=A9UYN7_MONBE|nr:uncharacterized protein MONBRDRAFT_25189 [Monosiga brevicollis MX1]EDQ89635.1 predicted protein [Monosiga brevicollis MX1]|eukprot:XP_001745664.1 hypothetical protein [Monosiga brevicollis MX1]
MGQTDSKSTGMQRRSSVSAFLPSPKTDITSMDQRTADQKFGLAYMQGWRAHMEDAHITQPELPGLPGWSFYSVIDGHAGAEVAHYSEDHLLASVLYELLPVKDSLHAISDAMHRAFLRHDRALFADNKVRLDNSGGTCTSVLVSPTHYIFVNLGDSRSLLCRGGKLAFQTRDHKPILPQERTRIRNAGGFVINGRVDGGLAISRAFGDFDYKRNPQLGALEQKVVADPDVTLVERDLEHDDFLLLCCDGIFDVMSNATAIKFVATKLRRSPDNPKAVCQALLKRCLELGSRDNMSACLVVFNKEFLQATHVSSAEERPAEQALDGLATSVAFNAMASAVAEIVNQHGSPTSSRSASTSAAANGISPLREIPVFDMEEAHPSGLHTVMEVCTCVHVCSCVHRVCVLGWQ